LNTDKLLQSNIKSEILESQSSTIMIGGNGGREFIGIKLNFKNHIIIGSSFTDFLIRLDEKKE
jgi:hypothetical protein